MILSFGEVEASLEETLFNEYNEDNVNNSYAEVKIYKQLRWLL